MLRKEDGEVQMVASLSRDEESPSSDGQGAG